MKSRLFVRPLAFAAALLPLLWLPAACQTQTGQTAPRGQQRGPAPEAAPCFRTAVPSQPFDIVLGRPTGEAVTVSVMAYADLEGYVEWGTAPGVYAAHTDTVKLPAGQPVLLTLHRLAPNTGYFYRLATRAAAGDFALGVEHHFHTQRARGQAFTFTLTADSHLDERTNIDLYSNTLRNALADSPDFHIDLGDTFMGDKVRGLGQPLRPMYLAQRYYFGLLCPAAPLFFVSGNHDGESGGADPEAVALRQQLLPNPLPDGFYSGADTSRQGNYYAWTWGDALFIVLDPFTFTTGRVRTAADNWNRTLGETQYRWLQQTLAGSDAALKFVFIHHLVGGSDRNGRGGVEAAPYFEWGGHDLSGKDEFTARRPGWGAPIHQLLVQHQVTAVFHGHDHFYARQELDGIIFQEVPQPGWFGGEQASQAAEYGYRSGTIMPSSGHLRVLVSATGATVEYVRSRLPAQAGVNREVTCSYQLARGARQTSSGAAGTRP